MENNNAIAVQEEKKWSPEQVNTIKSTVAPKATNEELDMFLSISSTYGLDPFLREIWCVDMGGRTVITTGRDGYLKIANRNPNYDGMVGDVVRAGDKFSKEGDSVNHLYGTANRGPIVGAYAIVYRKDRTHPTYVFAPFAEYNTGRNSWEKYPSAMILKVAESMALKRAFSISGLVTKEEIGTPQEQKQQEQRAQPQTQSQVKPTVEAQNTERKTQISQVYQRYLAVFDGQKNHVFNAMKKITGKDHSADYTSEDIKALFEDIIKREDEKMNKELQAQQQTVNTGNVENVIEVPIVPIEDPFEDFSMQTGNPEHPDSEQ